MDGRAYLLLRRSRNYLLTSVLASCLLLAYGGCGSSPQNPGRAAVVALVVDGDTIELRDGTRVRLVQIDAPEERECHAKPSTELLRRTLPQGTSVTLRADPSLDWMDQHGRLLRYVFAGGRNVNLELVRKGAASVYFFSGRRGVHAGEFLEAAQAAQARGRGAWGRCDAALHPDERWHPRRRASPDRSS